MPRGATDKKLPKQRIKAITNAIVRRITPPLPDEEEVSRFYNEQMKFLNDDRNIPDNSPRQTRLAPPIVLIPAMTELERQFNSTMADAERLMRELHTISWQHEQLRKLYKWRRGTGVSSLVAVPEAAVGSAPALEAAVGSAPALAAAEVSVLIPAAAEASVPIPAPAVGSAPESIEYVEDPPHYNEGDSSEGTAEEDLDPDSEDDFEGGEGDARVRRVMDMVESFKAGLKLGLDGQAGP
jgi:hypothetical protein